MKTTGKEFVAAIIAILKEKHKAFIQFDPKNYDNNLPKDALPWCNTLEGGMIIGTIGHPNIMAYMEEMIDEDRKRLKEKGYPNCICIIVWPTENTLIWGFFDGTEDENWKHIFINVYDELRKKR